MLLGNLLDIPDETQAVLWDMDGVLIDSLGLDYLICVDLLRRHHAQNIDIPPAVIRDGFALSPRDFWHFIFQRLNITVDSATLNRIVDEYETERRNGHFPIHAGIEAILTSARHLGLKQAVVSNNPRQDVIDILARSGIDGWFDAVVGNDQGTFQKKPAPDTYLHGASVLSVDIHRCVVVEDSLLGAEAGKRAGAYTVAVATGGTSLRDLERSGLANICYQHFAPRRLEIAFGNVRVKRIVTPNDFVSHMVEHIAWRLGLTIDLVWPDTNWAALGLRIGQAIRRFEVLQPQSAALGMIDDGSAEVYIDLNGPAEFVLEAIPNTDIDWFLSLRCEQIDSGQPLVSLLQGLTDGLRARVQVRICSVEDPHHAWEGIFRSIGIALSRLVQPITQTIPIEDKLARETCAAATQGQGRVAVLERSASHAVVVRETAETVVQVSAALAENPCLRCELSVAESIDVHTFPQLLEILAVAAGLDLDVSFRATTLNSSHVVLEDVGLVFGRALLEIFLQRMDRYGVNGAGSSVKTSEDFFDSNVQVGISIEGRKFVKFVPFSASTKYTREHFLIGPLIYGSTRAEDLDDFLDGLAGGLNCSIIVHLRDFQNPELTWVSLFEKLGQALKECFGENIYRKGVPAGVKATLI